MIYIYRSGVDCRLLLPQVRHRDPLDGGACAAQRRHGHGGTAPPRQQRRGTGGAGGTQRQQGRGPRDASSWRVCIVGEEGNSVGGGRGGMTYWVGSLCGSIPTLPPPTLPLPPQSPSLTPAASDLPSLLPQPLPTLLLCRRPGERCGPPRGPTSCQGSMALDSGWEGPTWARRCSRYSRWAAVGGGRWCVTMACERQADSRRVSGPRGGSVAAGRVAIGFLCAGGSGGAALV